MRRRRLLLVTIVNKNLGDSVIADCAELMIDRALGAQRGDWEVLRYSAQAGDLWQIRFADAVVFAGGGVIKFRKEDFYRHTAEIVANAQKWGVPVFFNCVGAEGFDPSDERCMMLKNALNSPCVRGLTLRDDTELVRSIYLFGRQDIRVKAAPDSAVFAAERYRLRASRHKPPVIGLGVARGDIFSDHGYGFSEEQVLEFWVGTVRLLEEQGYSWRIFTNGFDSDERFADKLLSTIGHGEKFPRPVQPRQLCEIISGFDGVIAVRMHANIIAWSLGVPSVGLVWNDKLAFWGERSGTPERFLYPRDISPERVSGLLRKALKQGVKRMSGIRRNAGIRELRRFLLSVPGRDIPPYHDFGDRMIAVGLGGSSHVYKNTNSAADLPELYRRGYRWAEADVRLTSDGVPVCVNGWGKGTFKLLGEEFDESRKNGLSFSEFSGRRLINGAPVSTLDEVLAGVSGLDGLQLIIDVGRPDKETERALITAAAEALGRFPALNGRAYIRLQRERDVRLWEELGSLAEAVYFLPSDDGDRARQLRAAQFCNDHNIRLVSVLYDDFGEEAAQLLRERGLRPVVFSCVRLGDMVNALNRGAFLVGSFHYSPDYVRKLTSGFQV